MRANRPCHFALLILMGAICLAGCVRRTPDGLADLTRRESKPVDEYSALVEQARSLYDDQGPPEQVRSSLDAAHRALAIKPHDPVANFLAARACFWLVDFEAKDTNRCKSEGTEFGRKAASSNPENAEYQYYLALNLGLKMRDSTVPMAMIQIPSLVKALEKVIEVNEAYDDGGALRVLGMLYLRAPPWPVSVGDEEKALELLTRAAKKYPEHPMNHLFLAEALAVNEMYEEAEASLAKVRETAAKQKFQWRARRWLKEADQLEQKINQNKPDRS